ncbi:MAG: hypothetical protein WED04_05500 [Promethearchaeati archaeon SRVP18_Atabeyarchaeia-1]
MLKGLLVIHESGTPIYTFSQEKISEDRQLLLSGFLSAIETFASETNISPDGGSIHSIRLSQSLLTFRLLCLENEKQETIKYFFVLITDINKNPNKAENEELLEYVILNFLSYKNSAFRQKMRQFGYQREEFGEFDDFMNKIIDLDWKTIKKKIKPVPGSLLQGVLNEVREYIPLDQILQLNPKIVRLGTSYAWLSDDLPVEEEKALLDKIRDRLSRLFGPNMFDSIVANVTKQLQG